MQSETMQLKATRQQRQKGDAEPARRSLHTASRVIDPLISALLLHFGGVWAARSPRRLTRTSHLTGFRRNWALRLTARPLRPPLFRLFPLARLSKCLPEQEPLFCRQAHRELPNSRLVFQSAPLIQQRATGRVILFQI